MTHAVTMAEQLIRAVAGDWRLARVIDTGGQADPLGGWKVGPTGGTATRLWHDLDELPTSDLVDLLERRLDAYRRSHGRVQRDMAIAAMRTAYILAFRRRRSTPRERAPDPPRREPFRSGVTYQNARRDGIDPRLLARIRSIQRRE